VATVEHLLASLRALEIDNVRIDVDGPEIPVMDGSAAPFLDALDEAGVEALDAPQRAIKVLKPVSVSINGSRAELTPHHCMRVEVEIDFDNPIVGRQQFASDIDARLFRLEIARARTFGFLADVEALWSRGLALGASLDNAIVIGEDRILNSAGLRFANEFVRHKTLDAVGDLALAGAAIIGRYSSYRGGHRLNVMAVAALMADESAWTLVDLPDGSEAGVADGIMPATVPVFAAGAA
jgi:UDP-3-O-[3-hydroxymyristoyl] N-acetylglucosamine deacetylase